jgi:hypothetical protein
VNSELARDTQVLTQFSSEPTAVVRGVRGPMTLNPHVGRRMFALCLAADQAEATLALVGRRLADR